MLSLYVDTAIREDAAPLLDLGIFRGVTTNPLLLQRAGLSAADLPDLVKWVLAQGVKEVFCQAWGDSAADLVTSGEKLHGYDPKVVVKVAATRAGTQAAATLTRSGIPVLLTAVYSAPQAVLAASAGCSYIAPYLGRMGDAGRPAYQEVLAMHRLLTAIGAPTKVLVASLRNPNDVVMLAQEGVECFALPAAVAAAFFTDPLTLAAAEAFEQAARGES